MIAAVKRKPVDLAQARVLFIVSIVFFTLSLIASLIQAIVCFVAAREAPLIIGTNDKDSADYKVAVAILITLGVFGVLGVLFSALVIGLCGVNLRTRV